MSRADALTNKRSFCRNFVLQNIEELTPVFVPKNFFSCKRGDALFPINLWQGIRNIKVISYISPPKENIIM